VTYVRPDGFHDLVFGQVDLRIQIGNAELTASSATGRHLDYAERCARIGKENSAGVGWVLDLELAR
jgi:hypothetical protein